MQEVYDPEKEKTLKPKENGEHDDLGVPSEQREAENEEWGKRFNNSPSGKKQKEFSGDQLQQGEESDASPSTGTVDQKEADLGSSDDQVGKGYQKEGKSGIKGKFWTKRKAATGGIIGLLIGGVFGISSILHGPIQFIQFGQLLQRFHFSNNENFSDSRTGRLYMYLTTRSNPNQRNLGIIMNRPASRYERFLKEAGIEMNFDHPTKNGRQVSRIQSFRIDSKTVQGKNTLDTLRKNGVDIPSPDIDGKVLINARGEGGTKLSRSIIRGSIDSINMNKISGALAKRLLIRRAKVDFHPLKNKAYETGQDRADSPERRRQYNEEVREETAERDKTGADARTRHVSGVQEDPDGDGTIDNDTTGDAERANAEIDAGKEVDTPGKLQELKLRYGNLIKGAGLVGAGVGVVCAARSLGDQAEAIEHANIILPLIRIGTRIVATGNQVMASKGLNLDELGAMNEALYSKEEGSWASARSIQTELGQEQTGPDMPDEARPSQVGQKPVIFEILSNGAIGGVCGINNAIGGLPIIKQVGQISDAALNGVLGQFGWSMSKLMTSLASLFAAEEVNALAEGSTLGNYANYGARLAANDSAISMGGRALDGTETAMLDSESNALHDRQLNQKPLFARYLDLNNPDSLASKSLFENPELANPKIAFASLIRSPTTLFSSMAKKAFPKVSAQTNSEYNYGFPEYGYSLDEQDDERLEDPLENAELIEPRLDELNKRYEGCFNTQVSPAPGGSLVVGDTVKYEDANRDKCKDSGKSFPDSTNELIRYRMYLADMVTAHTLACYEGEEASCNQLFQANAAASPTATAGSGQIEGNPYSDSSSVQCATGTKDLGVHKGYVSGNEFPVRLCSLPNLPSTGEEDSPGGQWATPGADGHAVVNSRVSGAWFKLVNDAKADGITLTARSSFRSMQHQQALWNARPDTSAVARPGYSSHQAGVAIDFSNMSGQNKANSCAQRARDTSSRGWVWMRDNAEGYGFKQFSNEAWHWDALPMANRCGTAQP